MREKKVEPGIGMESDCLNGFSGSSSIRLGRCVCQGSGREHLQDVPLNNSDGIISAIQAGCVRYDGHNNLTMFTILGIKVYYVQNNERNESCLYWMFLQVC